MSFPRPAHHPGNDTPIQGGSHPYLESYPSTSSTDVPSSHSSTVNTPGESSQKHITLPAHGLQQERLECNEHKGYGVSIGDVFLKMPPVPQGLKVFMNPENRTDYPIHTTDKPTLLAPGHVTYVDIQSSPGDQGPESSKYHLGENPETITKTSSQPSPLQFTPQTAQASSGVSEHQSHYHQYPESFRQAEPLGQGPIHSTYHHYQQHPSEYHQYPHNSTDNNDDKYYDDDGDGDDHETFLEDKIISVDLNSLSALNKNNYTYQQQPQQQQNLPLAQQTGSLAMPRYEQPSLSVSAGQGTLPTHSSDQQHNRSPAPLQQQQQQQQQQQHRANAPYNNTNAYSNHYTMTNTFVTPANAYPVNHNDAQSNSDSEDDDEEEEEEYSPHAATNKRRSTKKRGATNGNARVKPARTAAMMRTAQLRIEPPRSRFQNMEDDDSSSSAQTPGPSGESSGRSGSTTMKSNRTSGGLIPAKQQTLGEHHIGMDENEDISMLTKEEQRKIKLARKAERARMLRKERLDRLASLEDQVDQLKSEITEKDLFITQQSTMIANYETVITCQQAQIEQLKDQVAQLTMAAASGGATATVHGAVGAIETPQRSTSLSSVESCDVIPTTNNRQPHDTTLGEAATMAMSLSPATSYHNSLPQQQHHHDASFAAINNHNDYTVSTANAENNVANTGNTIPVSLPYPAFPHQSIHHQQHFQNTAVAPTPATVTSSMAPTTPTGLDVRIQMCPELLAKQAAATKSSIIPLQELHAKLNAVATSGGEGGAPGYHHPHTPTIQGEALLSLRQSLNNSAQSLIASLTMLNDVIQLSQLQTQSQSQSK